MISITLSTTGSESNQEAKSAVSSDTSKTAATTTRAEDDAFVRRAQQGDLAAYDELVRRYQERVYATLYQMTSNHEDANDLAQEAFIKAYQIGRAHV